MLRIISFTIHKHPFLGGKTFELSNPEELSTKNYYSVVIGPNGTGKSYMLNNLIEAFNEIALLKTISEYKPRKRFTLIYYLHGHKFNISTKEHDIIYERNGDPISAFEIELPYRWLASSVTINDKYPILNYFRKTQIPQYTYLGIRSASNNAFISRITINTVLYFIDALRKGKDKQLITVYNLLSLRPELEIVFTGGPMLKLEKREGRYSLYKTPSKIIEPHVGFLKKNKSKISYRADNYRKHIENISTTEKIFEFMQSNQHVFEKSYKLGMQLRYSIHLTSITDIQRLLKDWSSISIMLDLELIKISKFLITKDSAFKYEEASSGESHLLTSLHGIIANLEDNSLVIIDEPEVSLHPNWQLEYLDILKSIIDNYTGVNVIIATHSNFLVSSLKNEESRITSIKREKDTGEIIINELDYETFGWEPESILYNIFEVANTRNKYFELDLRNLISLVSTKSNDKKEISRLLKKIRKFLMVNNEDPLQLVINQAENYLEN